MRLSLTRRWSAGFFGIAADTLFGESCREDAKFTELHALAIGKGISNAVESELDHGEDFLLCEC